MRGGVCGLCEAVLAGLGVGEHSHADEFRRASDESVSIGRQTR
jgi:hypothetical protein